MNVKAKNLKIGDYLTGLDNAVPAFTEPKPKR